MHLRLLTGCVQTFEQLEKELLNGQKLQGTLTCKEVIKILQREGAVQQYPLFKSIHAIAYEVLPRPPPRRAQHEHEAWQHLPSPDGGLRIAGSGGIEVTGLGYREGSGPPAQRGCGQCSTALRATR